MQENILGIVNIFIRARENAIDYAGLEVEENSAGNISRIVRLIEENILAVANLCCERFEIAVAVDTVFQAELLPELRANYSIHSQCACC